MNQIAALSFKVDYLIELDKQIIIFSYLLIFF